MSKMITLDDGDAATVRAILMTHAEMQDLGATKSMELHASLTRDVPGEESLEMRTMLQGQVDDLELDVVSLNRIALLFA